MPRFPLASIRAFVDLRLFGALPYPGGAFDQPAWLMDELRDSYTIAIVTHSMQQAARVSQRTAFFHLGELVEYGPTEDMFTSPKDERPQGYITARFG